MTLIPSSSKLASFQASSSSSTISTRVDPAKYEELKLILFREKSTFQNWLGQQIDTYLKNHGDGNPNFTLDQFDSETFQACPAFFRDMKTWEGYLKKIVQDPKRWTEFDTQLNSLLSKTNKVFKQN